MTTQLAHKQVTDYLEWAVPGDLAQSPAVENRNQLARKYADRSVADILDIYVKMTAQTAQEEFTACLELAAAQGARLSGVGVEVGAGIGIFSATAIARYPQINSIYAVEVVPEVVRLLQRKVVASVCGDRSSDVIGVVGSFDDMELADGSCDFCIEYASLHHSPNLVRTLREIARVLKPGAPLIAVDRSHHNGLSETQREFMLNVEYSASWKAMNGYPPDSLTRRMNGEQEIRLHEWERAFADSGFELEKRIEMRPLSWDLWKRKLLLSLPFALRKARDWLPSRVRPQQGELQWMTAALLGFGKVHPVYTEAPREHTLFIARRKR